MFKRACIRSAGEKPKINHAKCLKQNIVGFGETNTIK